MAKKGTKEEEKKKEENLFNLALNALVGKEGETTQEAAKSFLDFWQRKRGESIVSGQNVLKAIGVIAGYAAYRHVDPVPDSKIDNIAVFAGAVGLLTLLVVSRSNEFGGRFPQFESIVLQRIKDNYTPEQKREVLKFIRELSNWQEKRIINLLKVVGEDGKTSFDSTILKDAEMREILLSYIGEEPSLKEDVDKTIVELKKFFAANWPKTKEAYHAADAAIAGQLREFRSFLNSKGIRRDPPKKDKTANREKIQKILNLGKGE